MSDTKIGFSVSNTALRRFWRGKATASLQARSAAFLRALSTKVIEPNLYCLTTKACSWLQHSQAYWGPWMRQRVFYTEQSQVPCVRAQTEGQRQPLGPVSMLSAFKFPSTPTPRSTASFRDAQAAAHAGVHAYMLESKSSRGAESATTPRCCILLPSTQKILVGGWCGAQAQGGRPHPPTAHQRSVQIVP